MSALAGPVALALADVDPASDVLLLQNVFVPYKPKVCNQLKDQLTSLTDKTKAAGYPLKVAIVGSRQDLGGAPQFFGNPQGYAKFLGQELSVYGPDVGKNLQKRRCSWSCPRALAPIRSTPRRPPRPRPCRFPRMPTRTRSRRPPRSTAPKMATAAGHPVAAEKPASGCTKKGTSFLVFLAPIVVLLIGGLLLRYGLRPRPPAETASADDELDLDLDPDSA